MFLDHIIIIISMKQDLKKYMMDFTSKWLTNETKYDLKNVGNENRNGSTDINIFLFYRT